MVTEVMMGVPFEPAANSFVPVEVELRATVTGVVVGKASPNASCSWTVIAPNVALFDAAPVREFEVNAILAAVAGVTVTVALGVEETPEPESTAWI